MLQINDLHVSYGQVKALMGVSVDVSDGQIVSIIGANGAGKSSLMRAVMGDVKAQRGSISFNGSDLKRRKTHQIVEEGVVYVPEGRQVFAQLSVQDNLEMGAYCRRLSKAELETRYEEAYTLFPILKERRRQLAGTLSGGQQQMLALCRGLMSQPKIMLLDEPSLGLAPIIVDEVFETIERVNREQGISILLVEQNAYMAIKTSSYCYVLENGLISTHGKSEDILRDPKVKVAYLGG